MTWLFVGIDHRGKDGRKEVGGVQLDRGNGKDSGKGDRCVSEAEP